MLNEAFKKVAGQGQQAADEALGNVFKQIEKDIATGKLRPYEGKDVFIP
jgi:hypothetical protein